MLLNLKEENVMYIGRRTVLAAVAFVLLCSGPAKAWNQPPIGHLDQPLDYDSAAGWACDLDVPEASIDVHLYFGGRAQDSPVTSIGVQTVADRPSEPLVGQLCGGGEYHRFLYDPATDSGPDIDWFLGPGVHPVYAYGINTGPGGNSLLNDSPRAYAVAAEGMESELLGIGSLANVMREFPVSDEPLPDPGEPDLGGAYAYAPSIIFKDGRYHLFTCSGGHLDAGNYGDVISYQTSEDGFGWSDRRVVLRLPKIIHLEYGISNVCDPSVVRFKDPENGRWYYYLYFSSTSLREGIYVGTFNAVARSHRIDGPYHMYYGPDIGWRGPGDPVSRQPPAILQLPQIYCTDLPIRAECYGAGQPTVVNRHGLLHLWYRDTMPDGNPDTDIPTNRIFMMTSQDGLAWRNPIDQDSRRPEETNVGGLVSPTIKYDSAQQKWIMYAIEGQHGAESRLLQYESSDGIDWTEVAIEGSEDIEAYAHNPGAVGDEYGGMAAGWFFVGYGYPDPRRCPENHFCRARWDVLLHGVHRRWYRELRLPDAARFLVRYVERLELPRHMENSYLANVGKIETFIENAQIRPATNQLRAFIRKVDNDLAHGDLDENAADALISKATDLVVALSE